jgi:hypothetical protein
MKKIILCITSILTWGLVAAQGSYTIKMNVKVEGLPAEYAAYGEQDIANYFKDDKSKTEISSMMFNAISFYDGKTHTSLTDAMGNKTGYTATDAELESADKEKKKEKPIIEYGTEKKMIAGYECVKTTVTSKDKDNKENKVVLWVTDQIKISPQLKKSKRTEMVDMSDVKGYPLGMEFGKNSQGQDIKIVMTATEVLTDNLDDSIFVPDTKGYKMMSFKEWMEKQKSMGRGGQ